ncbi:Transcription-repair-coupling factor [Phycisphaerae bacterium RAS1]|nr:Transcription-repair-coupling factor [Phycisphaerae bacterium RAS1]
MGRWERGNGPIPSQPPVRGPAATAPAGTGAGRYNSAVDWFDVIRSDERVDALASLLTNSKGGVTAEGLWGSSAPILAAIVAERLGRPLLLITAHADEADDCRDDIETVIGTPPELLPALESLSGEPGDNELEAERVRLCVQTLAARRARADKPPVAPVAHTGGGGATGGLSASAKPAAAPGGRTGETPVPPGPAPPLMIVAPILALMQPTPTEAAIDASSLMIDVGLTLEPDALVAWLDAHGFSRADAVDIPGDFAHRGGIVDVFCAAFDHPIRIEFFGDSIESIRVFDPGTQRSTQTLQSVQIPAAKLSASSPAARRGDQTTGFLSLLPADAIIALAEPAEIQEIGRTYWQRLGEQAGIVPADAVLRRSADFSALFLHRFGGVFQPAVAFGAGSLPQFEARSPDSLASLAELAREAEVVVLCDNPPEEQRLREMLEGGIKGSRDRGIEGAREEGAREEGAREEGTGNREPGAALSEPAAPSGGLTSAAEARGSGAHGSAAELAPVRTTVGVIHRGFRWGRRAFVPHHELFHRYRQRRTLRRVAPARPIDTFFDLNLGDAVVHIMHGIGRFTGLKTVERDGRRDEYLALEFADKAVVNVPVSQIHLVQKYIGSFHGKPKLSTIGGTAWKKAKQRAADAVGDLAAELLGLQAQRATQPGIAYPSDTSWQQEFEGSFLYTETPDQLRALGEIKSDMLRPRPMDRLVCGDVGYGKTELAMRAVFKVVEYGKQVAVLVPTTVLAEQHFQTFCDRMADYPFSVEVLSRFRTKAEQGKIVERARKGQVDVLIGTHRLLSTDVRFSDLGLVVIDEEQRFGVEAKEKLKQLRATVDVLTLSATPIPRTLHMSLLGMRDISSLATPPLDRRSIVTQVRQWDDKLVRDAILRELNREGQVYLVHNFVRSIHNIANHVRALVPEARVVVGHGQMGGSELEEVMLAFMRREADVLVSTNIIESGLDIPAANTIIIDRADRFGLADLHQLRGRVGRSKHRAYAYMLLSPKTPLTEKAARRLKAIEHYSDLGAGFQIAMRDLEIRGAGNILGAEQSGHIEAVGYEMYCQLLDEATRRLRNEPADTFRRVNLDIGVSASIPRGYIRSDRQRMEVYKRLAQCRTPDELASLTSDLRDAFGPIDGEMQTLLQLAEIRVLAGPRGVRSISIDGPDVVFAVEDVHKLGDLFSVGPGSPRVPDNKTVHWRLPKRLMERAALLEALRLQLSSQATGPRGEAAVKPRPALQARDHR